MAGKTYVDRKSLTDYAVKLYRTIGMSEKEAHDIVDSLVLAEERGVSSHGINKVEIYLKRCCEGSIRKKAELTIEKEGPSTLLIDAHNSMGYTVGTETMKMLIRKAAETGIAWASVKNSTHYGMTAYMTNIAVEAGMIGIMFSNSPACVAPWGGTKAFLGTDPFCVSVPAGKYGSVTLDMATTVVARGKIIGAKNRGEKTIPAGWALDREGRPTTDTQAALDGTLFSAGGVKGYGLAFMIDLLSSGLSGGAYGPHIRNLYYTDEQQGFSHSFCVIDISRFTDPDVFKERVDRYADEIKSVPRAEGVPEIYIPGEIELRNLEKNRKQGVPLAESDIAMLKRMSEQYGVEYTVKEIG